MTRGSELPRAGWYPDPQDAARLRYWDGEGWTGHTSSAMLTARGVPPAPPPETPPGWYRDAFTPTRARYWDGRAWHPQTYLIDAPSSAPSPPAALRPDAPPVQAVVSSERSPQPAGEPSARRTRRPLYRRMWPWVSAAALVALVVVCLALAVPKHDGPSAGAASANSPRRSSSGSQLGSPTTTSASPKTSSASPTTSSAPDPSADAAWRSTYWDAYVSKMQHDRLELRKALVSIGFEHGSLLTQAARDLHADGQTFSAYPPIPDSRAQQHWQTLVSDVTALADAASGTAGLGTASQTESDLARVNTDEQKITSIMGWT